MRSPIGYSTIAEAMPVFMRKQSDRLAATLNSPPLTWMLHSVALRNGMMPGSSLCTSAPSETRSRAPVRGNDQLSHELLQVLNL